MSDAKESAAGGRHRGREVALQVLYAVDLAAKEAPTGVDSDETVDTDNTDNTDNTDATDARGETVGADSNEQIFDRISENFVVPTPVVAFARELVAGVAERIDELDEILGVHARNWRVSRMAAVDRNVLRLAVYELRDTETPVAVVIDEAVDLARRFGSDSSPSFVNGVLDAVAREVRAA